MLLVDPRDEIGLDDAINHALTDSSLREQMRGRGLERARMFSWERCARKTLGVYEEALADGK